MASTIYDKRRRVERLMNVAVLLTATITLGVVGATPDPPTLEYAQRQERFLPAADSAKRLTRDALRAIVASSAVLSARTDAKRAKSALLDGGSPQLALLLPELPTSDDLVSLSEVSAGARAFVIVLSSDPTSVIDRSAASEAPANNFPILVADRQRGLSQFPVARRDNPFGLYIFDCAGSNVWFGRGGSWQVLASEVSAVSRTLAIECAAATPRKVSGHRTPAPSLFTSRHRSLETLPRRAESPAALRFADVLPRRDNEVTLVNFWATWCQPCRDEFPEVASRLAALGGTVNYVGVVTDGASAGGRTKVDAIVPTALRSQQYTLRDLEPISMLYPGEQYAFPAEVVVPRFVLFSKTGAVLFKCDGSILDAANARHFAAALAAWTSHKDNDDQ